MPSSVSVNSIVSDIMVKYDRNNNGVIDTENRGFLRSNESSRYTSNNWSTDDSVNLSSTRYSREKLFAAADAFGNNDQKVTRQELTNYITANYDKNTSGDLESRGWKFWKPANELEVFNREMGETSHTNSVSIPTNTKPTYSDPYINNKPVYNDPFSNSKPGSVYSDPFSNKPSNNKPVNSDPFSSKPATGGGVYSDPFSSKPSNRKPVNSDPISSKPSTGGGVYSDPFSNKTSGSSSKPSSVNSDPFSKK